MAEGALGDGIGSAAKGDRYQVVVHVDQDALEEPVQGDQHGDQAHGDPVNGVEGDA